jgi:hypothetical protein
MATSGLYGSSPVGSTIASPSSETSGLYGNTVNFGGTLFEWFIFQESATQPATPTGGSWNFVTNVGTAPAGWTTSPPTAPTNKIWVSISLVNSKTPSTVVWSVPGLLGVVPSTTVGTTTTGAAGSNASVTNSGTLIDPVLNFTIPRGNTGATGTAATIAVGTTTTTAGGTNATVTNSGTSGAAVFDFTIPRGIGIASGGTTGQYLSKASGTDYDTVWSTITGTLSYQGAWNASTNSPTLTSSVGTNGYYYVVSVAGSTNLNGITDWQVGDWAIYNGTIWQKLDQTNLVTSVAGRTGAVVLANTDISGLGTMSTQNANSVSITGGSISGLSSPLPVASGGTGVTLSSGANSVVLRDANANITTNCLFEGYISQAASGTTIVLTAASVQNYQITGSGGQIIRLPDATTLPNGATFTFNNNQSSGAITVQNNSSTTVATINSGGYVMVVLTSNTPAAGTWDRHDSTPSNVSWSTNTLDYPGSITSATWNGTTVALNRGGTGQTTAQAAMNSFAGAVTSGSYLRGNGTNVVMNTIQAGDVPTLNQNTTGSAATLTTARAIYGNNFDGSAALTQVIASTYGGTGNGFTKFTGPTTAERTFTLPDASSTIVVQGGALGTPSSGTVTNLTGTASININGTVGATTANTGAFTTLTATADSTFSSTGALSISKGTTGQQPASPVTGMLRYNTSTNQFEGYSGASPAWTSVGGATIVNDTSTSSNVYPLFAGATSGTALTINTSNAKLLYKPSTGDLTSTAMVSGNGITINATTVNSSYTIQTGNNGFSVGPMTIASGAVVTVSSGQQWVVI